MKRKFIINPASGKGLTQKFLLELKEYFDDKIGPYEYIITQNQDDIVAQTQKALRGGFEQIIAVGGDGTVNLVVNGFFENNKPLNPKALLAIAKKGTGSDFFKTVSQNQSPCDWRSLVHDYRVQEMDIGLIEFKNNQFQSRHYINMASVGLSAAIVKAKENQPKWLPGSLSYLLPTLKALPSYHPPKVSIEVDGQLIEEKILGVFMAKGNFAGGGMKFGSDAVPDDGKLDVTIIEKLGLLSALQKIPNLYSGKLHQLDGIHKLKAEKVVVQSATPLAVEFDGEIYGTTDITVTLLKKAIRLCFAPNRSNNGTAF